MAFSFITEFNLLQYSHYISIVYLEFRFNPAQFGNSVGLSMMCDRLGKENKTDLGDNQLRGRIGKLLYCL